MKKKVLKMFQYNLLLPVDGLTNSKWDITLINIVARGFSNIPPPTTGWYGAVDGETSVAAGIVKARKFRDKILHDDSMQSHASVGSMFFEIKDILKCLRSPKIHELDSIFSMSLWVEGEQKLRKLKTKGNQNNPHLDLNEA